MSRPLLAPVPDDAGRTFHHLPGLPFAVNLAEAGPLAQLHVAVNLDERNSVLHARAVISFLYIGSSQFSARMQRRACLLSRALAASLTPRASPSVIRACFSTSWMAVLMSMGPV